jgi:predicted DCC family thiol-disulfide oxidoreductase YuxK
MNRWTSRPETEAPDGLILFDGVCVLCSRWVRFVLARDRANRFRFLPIQSERGRVLAGRHGIDPDAPQTNAVVMGGRIWFKSDAALNVLSALPGLRPLGLLRRTPRVLRDPVYDLIAGSRYRLFGRTETCMVPAEPERSRFLE